MSYNSAIIACEEGANDRRHSHSYPLADNANFRKHRHCLRHSATAAEPNVWEFYMFVLRPVGVP